MNPLTIGKSAFTADDFLLIAGPCVIEDEDSTLRIAQELAEIVRDKPVTFVFKASYDKANRSSGKSYRGPGIQKGLEILGKVKTKLGLAVLSDVHAPEEVSQAAGVLDILQIPAFLSRQTNLLVAAAKTGKPINIKKGQFVAPQDMKEVINKVKPVNDQIMLTERGFAFGYNNLVVDMRSLAIMSGFDVPVIFDATHSVQLPGGGHQSGGDRRFIPVLARAAAGAGINGMFIETHPDPDNALSDSASMLSLKEFPKLLRDILRIHEVRKEME